MTKAWLESQRLFLVRLLLSSSFFYSQALLHRIFALTAPAPWPSAAILLCFHVHASFIIVARDDGAPIIFLFFSSNADLCTPATPLGDWADSHTHPNTIDLPSWTLSICSSTGHDQPHVSRANACRLDLALIAHRAFVRFASFLTLPIIIFVVDFHLTKDKHTTYLSIPPLVAPLSTSTHFLMVRINSRIPRLSLSLSIRPKTFVKKKKFRINVQHKSISFIS